MKRPPNRLKKGDTMVLIRVVILSVVILSLFHMSFSRVYEKNKGGLSGAFVVWVVFRGRT